MNKIESEIFRYRKVIPSKLKDFGFIENGGEYTFNCAIYGGQFALIVKIKGDDVRSEAVDLATGEPYFLLFVEGAAGSFVGEVRAEYVQVLEKIAESCFERRAFKGDVTQAVINYVREAYGDELEFLWADLPDCAIWRRKDNGKWYAAILTAPADKVGKEGGREEIIDVRAAPEEIDRLADGVNYFRGYHMNKKHWLTVRLDGSVGEEEIFAMIDASYALAKK